MSWVSECNPGSIALYSLRYRSFTGARICRPPSLPENTLSPARYPSEPALAVPRPENFRSSRSRSQKRTSICPLVRSLAEIEQMRLDREPRPIKCWPHAHICRRAVDLPSDDRFRRIHARLRQHFLFGRKIQRRHHQLSPLPVPGPNLSLERKRPPKHARRLFNMPISRSAVRIAVLEITIPPSTTGRHDFRLRIPTRARVLRAISRRRPADARIENFRRRAPPCARIVSTRNLATKSSGAHFRKLLSQTASRVRHQSPRLQSPRAAGRALPAGQELAAAAAHAPDADKMSAPSPADPSARARSKHASQNFLVPRCTPSKFPIVTTVRFARSRRIAPSTPPPNARRRAPSELCTSNCRPSYASRTFCGKLRIRFRRGPGRGRCA